MISSEVVDLSRLQFAITALYHFLFVPLTLGLSWLLVIMESLYVMTHKQVYKDMSRFWAKLFGINFAMGVVTGITLEFQFGTNWSYYSHYVGDIFGVPLAVEGLMAFFLESTFVGLMFFGWNRLSRIGHLIVTFLVALGSNLSALWILIANGWMNHPVGAAFNYKTMRMELTNLSEVMLNPVAQLKFVHTVSAGYVTAAMFVLGVSSWYLLKKRDITFAWRSFAIAAAFGLASTLGVIVLGDESGFTIGKVQKEKLAAIESEWTTEPPPATFTIFGLPNQDKQRTDYALRIPYALGLIATRSIDEPVIGLRDLISRNEQRIHDGIVAYRALQKMKQGDISDETHAVFDAHKKNLGYGLLVRRYAPDVLNVTNAQIAETAKHSIPPVTPVFWSFRLMVGLGILFFITFLLAFWFCATRSLAHQRRRWFLRWCAWAIPLPWLASECGWIVAEMGRQPWTITGVLPTFSSASSLAPSDLYLSISGFVIFYTALFVIEIKLMFKYAKLGPSSLHTGRYYHEQLH
ncbi:cytochrome ubiquinol oxidase subunit I [Candidatus Vallotia tarda]|uniref:Cytochrome bd ubiquinol oxidase subunit 1 n=1 Tax=Candidatus Vallotiella hemipterorum TaxID=1177213 RepID=A0A916NK60_9BURK|nr:cytochrome ubiquinol oxidase subunit I [Candidatus Vallotia tarda]CAG7596463.1 Cytochrome bd ubiquinol oxidase subunit 1 [Candidatus Vallotia tarda]